METLFLKILDMSIAASVAIAAVLIMRLLLNRVPKQYFYLLWAAAAKHGDISASGRKRLSIGPGLFPIYFGRHLLENLYPVRLRLQRHGGCADP